MQKSESLVYESGKLTDNKDIKVGELFVDIGKQIKRELDNGRNNV